MEKELKELIELGKSVGLEGTELASFRGMRELPEGKMRRQDKWQKQRKSD